MIKVSKATMATIRRFPELYKRQALQVIENERRDAAERERDAINITADSFVMAAMLVLIKRFKFGTRKGSTRVYQFIEDLQKIIDFSADYYTDAMAEGLRNKLHEYGIDYRR